MSLSDIGKHLKSVYRLFSQNLINKIEEAGYIDLRPSFLDILIHVCENEGDSIKNIGIACNLKKQTMTSHLNELVKRGYIDRKINENDKREQNVFLTDQGRIFKKKLYLIISELEDEYKKYFGETELERVELLLSHFHEKLVKKIENRLF